MQKQTSQKARSGPRTMVGGAGLSAGVIIVYLITSLTNLEVPHEVAAAIGSLAAYVSGLIMSRLGS